MPAPVNQFKAALGAGRAQIGLWQSLGHHVAAEVCAGAGFDWLLLDGEHAPNDLLTLLAQAQAVAAYPVHAVARVPIGEAWLIKQVLDIGIQTVLVPMVDNADQAREMARAMRYPPLGVRGVGAGMARASAYGNIADYVASANDQVCLLVQAESRAAVENIDAIAGTEGVDGVFIGPADLAADMGFPGNAGAPEVQAAIDHAIARIRAAGKAPGILTYDPAAARRYLEAGALFVAVGSDVTLLSRAARALRSEFAT